MDDLTKDFIFDMYKGGLPADGASEPNDHAPASQEKVVVGTDDDFFERLQRKRKKKAVLITDETSIV